MSRSFAGGADRARTGDLLVANQLLYQLSYSPVGRSLRPSCACRRRRERHGATGQQTVQVPPPIGFDLDLTLIDSRQTILDTWAAVATETGRRIDLADVSSRLGIKLEDELGYWFEPSELEEVGLVYRRHYVELARRSTPVLPGAARALAAVRAAGAAAVIITAKHPVSVAPSLAASGLVADQVFAHVHGPEKAEVLRRIAACAYVGDTPADMSAAVEAGVHGVGVTTGVFHGAALRSAGAATVLASLEEFPAWLAGRPGWRQETEARDRPGGAD